MGDARADRRRSGRRWVLAAVGAGLVVVGWLVWTGWTAYRVQRDLGEAADAARTVLDSADQGLDVPAAPLARFSREAASAQRLTGGPTWWVLTRLPGIGDDARGVRASARALDLVAGAGVRALLEARDRLPDVTAGDGVDLAAVADLEQPVSRAARAFTRAENVLEAEDPQGYVGPLRRRFDDLGERLGSARAGLAAAERATRLLPAMLGGDGPRRYLLAFENNAEVRGLGGLVGSLAYLEADGGRLRLVEQVSGASFGETPRPVLALRDAERAAYGEQIGTYVLNATMTPDVSRAADLIRARWSDRYPDRPVDGVVLLDTVALSYLVDVTGPIRVDGRRLTGENLVTELLNTTYRRLGDNDAQDAFFAKVARAEFERATRAIGEPAALLRAFARATREGRLLVHSFRADEQRRLAGTRIAGGYDEDAAGAQLAVTTNDVTGGKMSFYLRSRVDVAATSCAGGRQSYRVTTSLRSTAPQDAARLPDLVTGGARYGIPRGQQLVALRVLGPRGGSIEGLRIDGRPVEVAVVDDGGRPVGTAYVPLVPGATAELAWSVRSGPGQTGPTSLMVTPDIERRASAPASLPSAC